MQNIPASSAVMSANCVDSMIEEIAHMCNEHQSIDLALGVPDILIPAAIKEAAIQAIQGDQNQYTISWGSRLLRNAVSGKISQKLIFDVDPVAEVTITCGATEAIFNTITALAGREDEVIIFEPFYNSYIPAVKIAGAIPRYVKLHLPDWHFDEEELRAAFNNRTKAVVVNTPHNPVGKIFNKQELEAIAGLCKKWNVVCVCDEIYEHIIFDGMEHLSMLQIDGMRERTVVIGGLSKTYGLTGWRIGYIVAPQEITYRIRMVHDVTTYCAPAPLQVAAVVAFKMPDTYYRDLSADMQMRRDRLMNILTLCGFLCFKPSGAIFLIADISAFGLANDVEFAQFLAKRAGILSMPGSNFYATGADGSNLVRFCFGKSNATISEVEKRLVRLSV